MTRVERAWHLAGETVREIGILMLVFAPLQAVFEPRAIRPGWIAAVIVISLGLIACGILLETRD
jgi:hypothetical protein